MRREIAEISAEEAQAEEERLTGTRHFRPTVQPTLTKYERLAKLWRQ